MVEPVEAMLTSGWFAVRCVFEVDPGNWDGVEPRTCEERITLGQNEDSTLSRCNGSTLVGGALKEQTPSMSAVLELFLRAIETDDAAAMRKGFELLFSGAGGVSASDEFELRHEDYVMEMPQSGERITGRDRMRAMQEFFPGPPPSITITRVTGARRSWLIEGVNEYGPGDRWHVVVAMAFDPDGRMVRDTRYYAQDFEPPAWRAEFTDPR